MPFLPEYLGDSKLDSLLMNLCLAIRHFPEPAQQKEREAFVAIYFKENWESIIEHGESENLSDLKNLIGTMIFNGAVTQAEMLDRTYKGRGSESLFHLQLQAIPIVPREEVLARSIGALLRLQLAKRAARVYSESELHAIWLEFRSVAHLWVAFQLIYRIFRPDTPNLVRIFLEIAEAYRLHGEKHDVLQPAFTWKAQGIKPTCNFDLFKPNPAVGYLLLGASDGKLKDDGPPLVGHQVTILKCLHKLHADTASRLVATEKLAEEIGVDDAKNLKVAVASLKKKGFTDSKRGSRGGIWLTPEGKKYVEQAE